MGGPVFIGFSAVSPVSGHDKPGKAAVFCFEELPRGVSCAFALDAGTKNAPPRADKAARRQRDALRRYAAKSASL